MRDKNQNVIPTKPKTHCVSLILTWHSPNTRATLHGWNDNLIRESLLEMNSEFKYNVYEYNVPRDFVAEISKLDPKISNFALLMAWVCLAVLISTIRFVIPAEYFWYAYVPFIFLIAGRFGVFLQLIHEGTHYLLHPDRRWNHFIGTWFCARPVGVNFDGYAYGHIRHHAFTNTDKDPKSDTEKYRVCDFRNPRLYLLFLKDLLGITALSIFFDYNDGSAESGEKVGKKNHFSTKLQDLFGLCFVQLIILAVLFQFDVLDYILLWLVPAISPHMFLMRVRGIAEHGLSKQLGVTPITNPAYGEFYTRSFLTSKNCYKFAPLIWLEKALIASLNVYYHHEHHMLATVPYYNLNKLHDRVKDQVEKRNPDVYAKGYFAAAMRNLLQNTPVPQTSGVPS